MMCPKCQWPMCTTEPRTGQLISRCSNAACYHRVVPLELSEEGGNDKQAVPVS